MASLNLGQDVSNKRERKYTTAHIVAKSYPLEQAVKMCHYGSLININPSDKKEIGLLNLTGHFCRLLGEK